MTTPNADYADYASEAAKLTSAAATASARATSTLSRAALQDAISAARDASAMHTRAANRVPGPSSHRAEATRLNDVALALRRVWPTSP